MLASSPIPLCLEPNLSAFPSSYPAHALEPKARQTLALHALARLQPVVRLAAEHDVSPKFVYQQAAKAREALDQAFEPHAKEDETLFNFPVTKERVRQIVLCLLLGVHASAQEVRQFFSDVWDYSISIGTIHNIAAAAVVRARQVNNREDLSQIRVGAHDEIFQGDPVLVGIDPFSTYCYLLAQEPSRDATTWGCHLLDLVAKGFRPEYTVADFGKGLRAGQVEAMPQTPCWGDVFHAECDLGRAAFYLENRAWGAIQAREKLERQMDRAKKGSQGNVFSKPLALARANEARATQLADDIQILNRWLREDVLNLVGPGLADRRALYDFIVSELKAREELAPHRLRPVRVALENHREELLAFAERLEAQLLQIARNRQVSLEDLRALYELNGLSEDDSRYWQRKAELEKRLGWAAFQTLWHDLQAVLGQLVRASSLVENFNSRLRCYFFLRRQLGPDYLELLRFYFNHRRYPRSRKEYRVGKSPAEILSGKTHPHWLEQLGFTRFHCAA